MKDYYFINDSTKSSVFGAVLLSTGLGPTRYLRSLLFVMCSSLHAYNYHHSIQLQ